ncbi:flavodoxin family protein [Clostridium sp. DL1XJH146]
MKTLIINCSPRKKGDSSRISSFIFSKIKGEVEIIETQSLNIRPCMDCKYCYNQFLKCSIDDEMVDIYEKFILYDNIIIVSPVYFAGFPSTFKMLLDRMQVFWSAKYILKKKVREKNIQIATIFISGGDYKKNFIGMETNIEYLGKSLDAIYKHRIFIKNTDKEIWENNKNIVNQLLYLSKNLVV